MVDNQPSPRKLYGAVRGELIEALRSVDDTSASEIVPACPTWTVKDVVAHLCGLNAELLADVPGSLGSEESTSRQVADRSLASLDQVVDEWSSMADAIDERFGVDGDKAAALLADLVVHVYDLEEVLGQTTNHAAAATPMSSHRYVSLLQQRVASETCTALTIELSDGTSWPPSEIEVSAALTLRCSPHGFLRGVTGRLRRAEVEAFEWSSDPTDILDRAWNQYGPFRS